MIVTDGIGSMIGFVPFDLLVSSYENPAKPADFLPTLGFGGVGFGGVSFGGVGFSAGIDNVVNEQTLHVNRFLVQYFGDGSMQCKWYEL